MDTHADTSAPRGGWPGIEPSVLEEAGPKRGRRIGGGSGNCGNPLGCRYGRRSSNAVTGAGGVAESAETPYDDSPRGLASALGDLGNLQAEQEALSPGPSSGGKSANPVAQIAENAEIAKAAVGTATPTLSSPPALTALTALTAPT
jgi:hypothetical protein